jgi:nucleoid DNA-binding protein
MNKIIQQLAKKSSVSQAQAADQIDNYIHDVLRKLRKGQRVPVPGVGVITPNRDLQLIKDSNVSPSRRNRR